jgi:hypothetical protein
MVLTPGALRAIIATWFVALAAIWVIAWLAPGIGLYHDDGVYLVTAKALASGHGYTIASLPVPIAQTKYPPVFPALLALFALISDNAQWLKLVPALCGLGWLYLTWRLLVKMGASANSALFLVGLTASSPTVVFLATNLMSETLFALLVMAALLCLLDERVALAGLLAGLATLTRTAGVPLIAACILTLAARARLRAALVFAGTAMVVVAPWFGWSMAHAVRDAYYGSSNYAASNIITGLAANEKAQVLGRNMLLMLVAPFSLLTNIRNMFSAAGTLFVFGWSLFVRRQFVPDMFVALYCLMLLCWTWPPERFMAPILPLLLWMVWRVFRMMELREALAAVVVIAAILPVWASVSALPNARSSGYFTSSGREADNWGEMQKMFTYIRANTPPESVILANLDPVFYLNTGRKAVRGFSPSGYTLFYGPGQPNVTPDQLSSAIAQSGVSYVALTAERDSPESPSFHNSVLALERGGVLEPVPIAGLLPEYRLLHVTR